MDFPGRGGAAGAAGLSRARVSLFREQASRIPSCLECGCSPMVEKQLLAAKRVYQTMVDILLELIGLRLSAMEPDLGDSERDRLRCRRLALPFEVERAAHAFAIVMEDRKLAPEEVDGAWRRLSHVSSLALGGFDACGVAQSGVHLGKAVPTGEGGEAQGVRREAMQGEG